LKEQNSDICYRIKCECELMYIRNTRQYFKERFDQHLNGDSEHSALSEHIIQTGHKVEWEDADVICTVRGDCKRFFTEMIHIRKSKDCLNKITDWQHLGHSYDNLLVPLT